MSATTGAIARHADCLALEWRGGSVLRVRIARTFGARFVGLLNRSRLDEAEGLLLVPGGSIHTWWMRFAIDVIFLDAQLEVLRVAANVVPWRFALAPRGTQCVLEVAAGVAQRSGIERGRRLRICR